MGRAGRPGAGLSTTAPMVIEGYSQGGGAAGWAAQLAPRYAPGLRLHGVAMGGTPANLQAVAAHLNGSAFFAFLGGAVIGFNAAYPSADLLSDLTPAGQAALAELDTMCQEQALVTYAGTRIQDYTAGGINPIGEPRWQKVLDANDLGAIKPQVPAAIPRPGRRGHSLAGRGGAAQPVVRDGRHHVLHQLSR